MPAGDDLWRFIQAEALDGLDIREGELTKMLVIAEVEVPGGAKTVRISRHSSGRSLRAAEESGLLTVVLTEVLD